MSGIYNPKDGLITKGEYILRRVEALLGRSYQVRVNGYEYNVKTGLTKKERIALMREAMAKADRLPQYNYYIIIDCASRRVGFESDDDMGGMIDNIPYMEYFLETPFADIKIYEKLW